MGQRVFAISGAGNCPPDGEDTCILSGEFTAALAKNRTQTIIIDRLAEFVFPRSSVCAGYPSLSPKAGEPQLQPSCYRRQPSTVSYGFDSVTAGFDALTEELSFRLVSAEREGSRKVFKCSLGPTGP